MDAAGRSPAGPRAGPEGAARRGPGPSPAAAGGEEAAYAEMRVSPRGAEPAPGGGEERADRPAAGGAAGGGGDAGGAAAPAPSERGGRRPEPPSSSSSSCPSPASKAGGFPATGDPASTEGKTSSSSFGYESEEDAAAAAAAAAAAPPGAPPGVPPARDEAHYISTQEIQLSEVDHDMDFDAGLAARWDFEDNNVIYSFVDYASFGSDETLGDTTATEEEEEEEENSCYLSTTASDPNNRTDSLDNASSAEIVSLASERDTPGAERRPSSGPSRPEPPGGPAAQLLLSIKAASRAINESSDARGKRRAVRAAEHEGDMSLRGPAAAERDAGSAREQARKAAAAAPSRLQPRCGAARAGEHSSGASSAVSELDDADKEVRSLTARAFRSLAYPCRDAPSPAASLADDALGVGRWATYLDLKCGASGPRAEPGRPRSGRSQSRALEFVVSKLDGEIAHVEAPRRLRAVALLEPGGAGAGKKSKFASSLLKNVISKKMQLEHEFKMERGEISDTSSSAGPGAGREPEGGGGGGRRQQSSRRSEGGSEGAAGEEAGEGGGRSPASKASTPREPAPSEEAGEAKRGAAEAGRATFLRSQNSAFRSWKEREAEKKKEERAPVGKPKLSPRHDWRADPGEISAGKSTKMSRLFVPAIQQTLREKEPGKKATECSAAAAAAFSSSSSSPPPSAKPKAPEIKISLGGLQRPRDAAFSIAQLLTPQIAPRPPEEPRGQQPRLPKPGDGHDKVPQFLVRDVRDGKHRAPGAPRQVRDVRKLIKSSYGCDSGDNSSDKGSVASDQGGAEQKPRQQLVIAGVPRSLSPVVITCQALGQAGSKPVEGAAKAAGRAASRPPEGTVLVHRTSGRLPVATIAPNKSDPRQPAVLKIVSKSAAPWRQQQQQQQQQQQPPPQPPPPPPAERGRGPEEDPREEGKAAAPVQNALEKLTAAVRSMEELYSFNKREWKRKSDPLPITDSHVLSLIASQERDAGSRPGPAAPRPPPEKAEEEEEEPSGKAAAGGERPPRRAPAADKVSAKAAAFESLARQRQRFPPPRAEPRGAVPGPPKPRSDGGSRRGPAGPRPPGGEAERGADCGDYLSLPAPRGSPGPEAAGPVVPEPRPPSERPAEPPPAAPPPVEGPPAALYRALPAAAPLLCFSPAAGEPFPQTQRKVLLDVSTGQCYLVDAPLPQPLKRRLFDPETGQYVEVPVPQQPPVAPVPLPLSPLALNAGAYGATYMLYPGLVPAAAVLPAAALRRPLSHPGSDAGAPAEPSSPAAEAAFTETPYYMATGKGPSLPQRGEAEAKPVISITAPAAGPRIVAPPSFDGTTMSFVVEHR